MNSFKDKVVLVSGAGKGIGRGIALAFAEEGAKVAVFDKNEEFIKKLQDSQFQILAQALDINDHAALKNFLTLVQDSFGQIDVLINNAGVGLVRKFDTTLPEDFDRILATNFKGSFFLTQMALPFINEGGSITFITSIHAEHPSLDPIYDGSKAAINNLVLNLSLSLAKRHIRVNAIAPGHIDVQTEDEPRSQPDVPLTKLAGLPSDIAEACLFLSDNKKARYITGAILPVTGGLHIPIARDIEF